MKKISIILIGCMLASNYATANSPLDSLTRADLIDRLTGSIPIKGNIYSCAQVAYNYSFLERAAKSCGLFKLNSAADTGNTMCHGWSMLKANGSFTKIRSIAKEAENDFDEKYSKSLNKSRVCSGVLKKYSDFIVE